MKRFLFLALILWACVFLLPLAILTAASGGREAPSVPTDTSETESPGLTTIPPLSSLSGTAPPETVPAEPTVETVPVMLGGKVVDMSLEELVVAVTAAEMPALFPTEALKAQAVAVRTYIRYKMELPRQEAHRGAVICDDPGHCCAIADAEALMESWGEKGPEYMALLKSAVESTSGEILVYNGKPILAVFHAMSGPRTEEAKDVWGAAVPYLISVPAPEGEALSPKYEDKAIFDPGEFKEAFLKAYPNTSFPSSPSDWFTSANRTASGMVKNITVGNKVVTGGELRALCGLRSANFRVSYEQGRLVFTTLGYGHGVGMSQYGAKALALEGMGYADILAYYYVGAELAEN